MCKNVTYKKNIPTTLHFQILYPSSERIHVSERRRRLVGKAVNKSAGLLYRWLQKELQCECPYVVILNLGIVHTDILSSCVSDCPLVLLWENCLHDVYFSWHSWDLLPLDKHTGSLEPQVLRCLAVESGEQHKITLNIDKYDAIWQKWSCKNLFVLKRKLVNAASSLKSIARGPMCEFKTSNPDESPLLVIFRLYTSEMRYSRIFLDIDNDRKQGGWSPSLCSLQQDHST